MSPSVSVLMPAFNAEKTLLMALTSMQAQTHRDWECVVVDDGSSDRTREVACGLSDRRIRFLRLEKNMGRGYARQVALDRATGTYIAMLDADDWIYPSKLQQQVDFLEGERSVAAVSTAMAIVDRGDQLVGIRGAAPGQHNYGYLGRIGTIPFAFAPVMIRSEVARSASFNSAFTRSEDADFLLRALLGRRYAIICEPLYVYREQGFTTLESVIASLEHCCRIFDQYKSTHPFRSRLEVAKLRCKQTLYRAASTAGLWNKVIARRSRLPKNAERRRYETALETILGACARTG